MTTNILFIQLLQAAPAKSGGGDWSFLIMMIAVFAIMYFFMIRPQNKQRKELQRFRDNLSVGQEIVTAGGIHGVVKSINDAENTVMVEVATGIKIKFSKSAILSGAASAQQTNNK